jgi:sodium-dependent dicarboxylate transporter 2/3/5
MNSQTFWWIFGPINGCILFLLLQFNFSFEMAFSAGVVGWMLTWWLSEAVPMAVTALLPILLFSSSQILSIDNCYAAYSDRFVFLFLGGFMLSIAFEKWALHERLAHWILSKVGHSPRAVLLGFMLATYLISMWISNTATALMMMPLAIGVIHRKQHQTQHRFARSLVLGIAYASSIGGMATLLGSPPNAALAGILESQFHREVGFYEWMKWGVPFSLCLLGIGYFILQFPLNATDTELPTHTPLSDPIHQPLSPHQKTTLAIFLVTALLWITQQPLANILGNWWNDSFIVLLAAVVLFTPIKSLRILNWEDTEKLPWGILLMFGGGLTMAAGCKAAGWMNWIGLQFQGFDPHSWTFQLIIIGVSVLLTALMSNLAMVAVFIPIVGQLAMELNIDVAIIAIPVGLAASCDFMFPMSTPPNAIAYSSGFFSPKQMFKIGALFNITATLLLVLFMHWMME